MNKPYKLKKWDKVRITSEYQPCSEEWLERWRENYKKLSQRDVKIVGMYK